MSAATARVPRPIRSPALSGLRSRRAASLAALLLATAAPIPQAFAQTAPTFAPSSLIVPSSDLAEALLPYSPYFFDFVVRVARSFAVVTYGARRFDAVTRDFVVSDLHIERGPFNLRIGRLRANASTSVLQGLSVDTRGLPMEPAAREALSALGAQTVTGDVTMTWAADEAAAHYKLDVSVDLDRIGRLDAKADIDGFHLLLPLDQSTLDQSTLDQGTGDQGALDQGTGDEGTGDQETTDQGTGDQGTGDQTVDAIDQSASDMPQVFGRLRSASLAYDDAGLAPVLFQIFGKQQGMSAAQLQGVATMLAPSVISSLQTSLPGGDSPAFKVRAGQWSGVVQRFLSDPRHIVVTSNPPTPFDLAHFNEARLDADAVERLDLTLSVEDAPAVALIDPASAGDGLPLAERLVEGVGVPLDVGRGVAMALSQVAAGNDAATATVLKGIVRDPQAAVAGSTAPAAYRLLILAAANGLEVPAGVMEVVRAKLSPADIVSSEATAGSEWSRTSSGAAEIKAQADAVASHDFAALGRMAIDAYEGTGRPRNATHALALAQVAAAGGNGVAASLRDDLLAANRDGRIALSLDEGRRMSDALWAEIVKPKAPAQ